MEDTRDDFYKEVKAQEGVVIGISQGELRNVDGIGFAGYCLLQLSIPGKQGFECVYLSDTQLGELICRATEFLITPR